VGAPLRGNVSSSSTCHDGRHRSSQSRVNNQAARWNNRWRCPVAGSPGTRERRRATKAPTLFAAPLRPFNLTSVHVLLHRGSVSRLPANWNTQHLARSRAGVSVARSELQAPSPFRNIAGSRPREVVKICNGLTETGVMSDWSGRTIRLVFYESGSARIPDCCLRRLAILCHPTTYIGPPFLHRFNGHTSFSPPSAQSDR
jgi:hypothetical protein